MKNMNKAREEFFKSIDTKELLSRIRRFRALNKQYMTDQEIANAISEVLCWDGRFIYITNIRQYPSNTPFFRIRKLNNILIPNDNLRVYSDLWEPPSEYVKIAGRLNRIGESLLYVTPYDATVPLKELHIQEGDAYTLIKYTSLKPIKVNVIGGIYDYDMIGLTDEKAIINHNIINDFLRDEFSRDVGNGIEHLYKISEIIAKDYFDLPPEDVQDAWAYSSIQDKEKYNVCFRPNIAHKLLQLEGALVCKQGETDDIIAYYVVTGLEEENKIEFHKLGSQKQKDIFPEIEINK